MTASSDADARQNMGFLAVSRRLRGFALAPAFARTALAALAFALPFEMEQPLARVGPLALSSVELFLYAAVGLSALAVARDRRRLWSGALVRHAAPLAWGAVVALSALRAPVEPQPALKFALRSLGGVTVYLAAASLLRTPRALIATAVALATGATLAALFVWIEVPVPGAAALLAPFHHRTFEVLGLPRPSGPFQYPNIAAMYLEATLPVVLVLGAALDAAAPADGAAAARGARAFLRRHRFAILTTAGAIWLGGAVLSTASRAGILTIAVVLGLLAARGFWPRGARARTAVASAARSLGWQALAALGGLVVVWLALMPSSPLMGLRMQYWRDPAWYQAAMAVVESDAAVPAAMRPGESAFVTVRIQNRGAVAWPHRGANRVAVSYHWKHAGSEEIAVFDGVRTALPRDLAPGEAATVMARVDAPRRPGRYRLLLDLVHEGVTWFGDRGNAGLVSEIHVTPDASPSGARAATAIRAPVAAGLAAADALPPRTELWKAAVAAWRDHPVLGLGPDNFRLAYGRYLGLERADERLHANSLYFETLASLGLLGMAALAFLMVAFWRVASRALAAAGTAGPERLLAPGLVAGLGAFLAHGLFDYFLEFTPTYGLVWLLAGMLMALDRPGPARESNRE